MKNPRFRLALRIAVALAACACGAPQAADAGLLSVCLDADNPPFSSRAEGGQGIDVDVAQAIAGRLGRTLSIQWIQVPARGGLGRALKQSIQAGACNLFLGLPVSGEAHEELGARGLAATRPYLATGYVLVTHGTKIRSLRDVRQARRIGAVTATPADLYLFREGLPRVPYPNNPELLRAVESHEVDAALVWAPALARGRDGAPGAANAALQVADRPDHPDLLTRFVIATRKDDAALGEAVDRAIGQLDGDGQLAAIAARHGLPGAAR